MKLKFLEDTRRDDLDGQGIPPLKRGIWLLPRFILLSMELLLSNPRHLLSWYLSFSNRFRRFTYCLPWMTFSVIDHISAKIGPESRVFEYGMGHSTIYWLKKGAEVYAVDHNSEWCDLVEEKIHDFCLKRATLQYKTKIDSYTNSIYDSGGLFDLIIVDGAFRHECLAASVQCVAPGGLLVLDNSDWKWFKRIAVEVIPSSWMKSIFYGPVPMAGAKNETTVWQRPI